MTHWNLTDENDLSEIATRYHEVSTRMLRQEYERGEVRPHSARREIIAHSFGLSVKELMKAVAQGTELNWQRHTADWTPEQRQEHNDHMKREIYPLIAEAFEEHQARQNEVDELNRLYDL